MENMLESNERTLVMFDSVCSGLSACLSLVNEDIKQMTEHRNKLVQIEQEQIQAKLLPAQELIVVTNGQLGATTNCNNNNYASDDHTKSRRTKRHSSAGKDIGNPAVAQVDEADNDPHHLASLKLLDKRLADSFSQALSLNELQKSSIMAAKQHANQSRPSIFQVLLGKYSGKGAKSSSSSLANQKGNFGDDDNDEQRNLESSNKTIIDDINKQTRLAMQYAKQLEAHLFKVEDLRAKYEMHLKMGLVVRSVARAYLTNNGSYNSSLARQRHCSSLVINDSSSLGTATHSSISSLNLSSWSSSAGRKRRGSSSTPTRQVNSADQTSPMFVSTISLNNNASRKRNKRINLAKLISSTTSPSSSANQKQHNGGLSKIGNSSHNMMMMMESPQHTYGAAGVNIPAAQHIHHNLELLHHHHLQAPNDWAAAIPESNNNLNNLDTLSRSNAELTASRLSLKSGAGKSLKSQQQQLANNSSKTTIKEFIENIEKIEAEFESYMGSFLLAIEDVQGFARVCPGDVFEITIKYGESQKFKTKISVLKDGRQKCDNRQVVFKSRISDVLTLKAYECKGLGKRVLLGHKLCETRDLFTARSQLMTISLNQTGSIKLNLIVTWNPLHFAPNSSPVTAGLDISHISLPPTPVSSSTLSSISSSVPSLNGTTTTINIQSHHRNKKLLHNNSNSHSPVSNDSQQQHYHHHNHHNPNDSMYQTVDPTYGYYIPPPDYITNEQKY